MVRKTAEERVDTDGANEYAMFPLYSPRPRQMMPLGSDPFGRANSMANRGMTTEDSAFAMPLPGPRAMPIGPIDPNTPITMSYGELMSIITPNASLAQDMGSTQGAGLTSRMTNRSFMERMEAIHLSQTGVPTPVTQHSEAVVHQRGMHVPAHSAHGRNMSSNDTGSEYTQKLHYMRSNGRIMPQADASSSTSQYAGRNDEVRESGYAYHGTSVPTPNHDFGVGYLTGTSPTTPNGRVGSTNGYGRHAGGGPSANSYAGPALGYMGLTHHPSLGSTSTTPTTPSTPHGRHGGMVAYGGRANGAMSSPRLRSHGSFPRTPRTPMTTQGAMNGYTDSPYTRSGSRPKRSTTPTFKSSRNSPNVQVVMGKQDDRGLLSDFFDEIKAWALEWVEKPAEIDREFLELRRTGVLRDIIVNMTDAPTLFDHLETILSDEALRKDLVAACVSYDIVYNTVCDTFLVNSKFPEADVNSCRALINEYNSLGEEDILKKDEVLLAQKALYAAIKENPVHRELRKATAKQLAEDLLKKFGSLMSSSDIKTRNHALRELFIKGYRIGFRLRDEAVKWRMAWPAVGIDFNPGLLINESRYLHGPVQKTMEKVSRSPNNYHVLFAMSPTITRFDYSTGVEKKEVIHKAMTHIAHKPSF